MFTGGFEFVFILLMAFLLFGPKRIPAIARVLGKGLAELQRASNERRSSVDGEICNLDCGTQAERNSVPAGDVLEHAHGRYQKVLPLPSDSMPIRLIQGKLSFQRRNTSDGAFR